MAPDCEIVEVAFSENVLEELREVTSIVLTSLCCLLLHIREDRVVLIWLSSFIILAVFENFSNERI